MQRHLYDLIGEMITISKDNPRRFDIVKKKLEKLTAKYTRLTGKNDLNEIVSAGNDAQGMINAINVAYGRDKQ